MEHEHFLRDLSIIQIYDLSLLLSPFASLTSPGYPYRVFYEYTHDTHRRTWDIVSRVSATREKDAIRLINDRR